MQLKVDLAYTIIPPRFGPVARSRRDTTSYPEIGMCAVVLSSQDSQIAIISGFCISIRASNSAALSFKLRVFVQKTEKLSR